jgi:hypothetical protein
MNVANSMVFHNFKVFWPPTGSNPELLQPAILLWYSEKDIPIHPAGFAAHN